MRTPWLLVLTIGLSGCGHTDEEMNAKQHEVEKLSADIRAYKAQMAALDAELAELSAQRQRLHALMEGKP